MIDSVPGKLVKGVYQRALFSDLSAGLITSLASAGIDLSKPLLESYPIAAWYRSIELTAESLFVEAPAAHRQRALGRHLIEVLDSRKLIKGPWLGMAKLMGPRRALKQAADLGGQFSPIRLEARERNAREFEVTVGDDQQSEFLAGLLEGLLTVLGARSAQVKVESAAAGQAVFSATWS